MNLAALSPLANHLWQSTVALLLAWLLTLALKSNRAAVRYRIWLAASVKFLVPFALLVSLGGLIPWRVNAPAAPAPVAAVANEFSQPFVFNSGFEARPDQAAPTVAADSVPTEHPSPTPSRLPGLVLLGVWLCGFVYNLSRWGQRWQRLRRLRQTATPLPRHLHAALPIPVMSTAERLEPGVFGIWKPVLLLPGGIAERMSEPQLETILAHELHHVRRRDNLTAALHMLVEAVFWFYPPVWWMGRRLAEERERACDEAVLSAGSDPAAYAEGILQVCRHYLETPLACATGVTGADLKQRVVAILANRSLRRLGWARIALLSAAGLAAVAVPMAAGVVLVPRAAVLRPAPVSLASTATAPQQSESALTLPAQSKPPSAALDIPKFDAVNIRASVPGAPYPSEEIVGGQAVFASQTMLQMIAIAYHVKPAMIDGGPSWMDADRFDIYARTAATPSLDTMRAMLQALLAERFDLATHQSERPMPAYALKIAESQPRLKKSADAGPPSCKVTGQLGTMSWNCQNQSMTDLTSNLNGTLSAQDYLDGPVTDATGLDGVYDFRLKFSGRIILRKAPEPGFDSPDNISLFDAMEKQLGLKLERQLQPAPVLVVDRVNRTPAPNPPGVSSDLPPVPTEFEVASVRPTDPAAPRQGDRYSPGGEVELHGRTLRDMIQRAYNRMATDGLDVDRIVGAPAWVDTDRFDIVAKTSVPKDEFELDRNANGLTGFEWAELLKSLLAKRFKLAAHEEVQPVQVYALSLAEGGPKLKPGDPTARSGCKKSIQDGEAQYACQNTSMAELASSLRQNLPGQFDHPAVDLTGLKGTYDFTISFDAPIKQQVLARDAAPGPDGTPPAPALYTAPSIFQSLDKQLGLKLTEQKSPLPVLVIDHIERTPTPN